MKDYDIMFIIIPRSGKQNHIQVENSINIFSFASEIRNISASLGSVIKFMVYFNSLRPSVAYMHQ